MTFEEHIRRERVNMSKSFAKLADFLLDSYIEAAFMTASELAHVLNLDAATVVRFSQHLGYQGYPQLQQEIRNKVKHDFLLRSSETEASGTAYAIASTALRDLEKDIEQMHLSLDAQALENLIEAIGQARRVVLVADSPGRPAARSLADFLEQGGFSVTLVGSAVDDLARLLHASTVEDLILAIEVTGLSASLTRALAQAQSQAIPTAVVVGAASLASARYADNVLAVQSRSSAPSGIVLVNALVAAIIHTLRWRYAERFVGAEASIAGLSQRLQMDDTDH